jgi:SET domain-containing protein
MKKTPRPRPSRRIVVRRSKVHGRGVFAARRIRPGARIVEYIGERLDEAAVDARYGGAAAEDPHTMVFQTGPDAFIDASVGGNAARFINHSCRPNCEALQEGDRIFIHAIRNIQPGLELTYDYSLEIEPGGSAARARLFACHCGAPRCRGTMLRGPS